MATWIVRVKEYVGGPSNRYIDTFNAKDLDTARRTLYTWVRRNSHVVNEMEGVWFALYKVTSTGKQSTKKKRVKVGEATCRGRSTLWSSPKTKGDAYLYENGTIGKTDKEWNRL